jgi:glycosyltransferase involved in cell wall biosynthesis
LPKAHKNYTLAMRKYVMKFIINTTNLQSGGALQVSMSLLEEWNRTCPHHQFYVLLSYQLSLLIDKKKFEPNFSFHEFNQNPTTNLWTILHFHKQLSKLEAEFQPDAVLSIFGPALWTPQKPHLVGFANGYYLFDESKYIQEKVLNNIINRIRYFLRRSLLLKQLKKEADHYWVETTVAQKKLSSTIDLNEKEINVIGNTYGAQFMNSQSNEGENTQFRFLYLSAYYPHKNFETLPGVIRILKDRDIQCQFMLTLTNEQFEEIFKDNVCKEYLINMGPVNPSETIKLYQDTDAVFMPSLLETFSANYPEAMKMDKPILSSNLEFAKEICGDAALYFEPENELDIADKICEIIRNKDLQQDLILKGQKQLNKFETPGSRAHKLISLLEEISVKKK